jgi:hypothetical protein
MVKSRNYATLWHRCLDMSRNTASRWKKWLKLVSHANECVCHADDYFAAQQRKMINRCCRC